MSGLLVWTGAVVAALGEHQAPELWVSVEGEDLWVVDAAVVRDVISRNQSLSGRFTLLQLLTNLNSSNS